MLVTQQQQQLHGDENMHNVTDVCTLCATIVVRLRICILGCVTHIVAQQGTAVQSFTFVSWPLPPQSSDVASLLCQRCIRHSWRSNFQHGIAAKNVCSGHFRYCSQNLHFNFNAQKSPGATLRHSQVMCLAALTPNMAPVSPKSRGPRTYLPPAVQEVAFCSR